MAACIAPEDLEKFKEECARENLGCVVVAEVSDENRLVMNWRNQTIVDMSRDFLNTNGVRMHVDVDVETTDYPDRPFEETDQPLTEVLQQANVASQIGLAEMFDASIGKSTVLMPFGGKTQHTPEQGSVQKLPVDGFTETVSYMTYGYNPSLSKYSPWLGAQYSVIEALAKLVSMGGDPKRPA